MREGPLDKSGLRPVARRAFIVPQLTAPFIGRGLFWHLAGRRLSLADIGHGNAPRSICNSNTPRPRAIGDSNRDISSDRCDSSCGKRQPVPCSEPHCLTLDTHRKPRRINFPSAGKRNRISHTRNANTPKLDAHLERNVDSAEACSNRLPTSIRLDQRISLGGYGGFLLR